MDTKDGHICQQRVVWLVEQVIASWHELTSVVAVQLLHKCEVVARKKEQLPVDFEMILQDWPRSAQTQMEGTSILDKCSVWSNIQKARITTRSDFYDN